MARTRVHNLNVSLDGYAAGEGVTFDEPIGGAGTRAAVTLTGGGELAFAAVGGSARLEYRRANPADPRPKLTAGRITPPGVVAEVP